MVAILFATRRAILTRTLTLVSLLIFAAAVFLSQYLVLFEFYREENVIREMGVATITLWGLLIAVVMSGWLVTHELEDRTAVLLLAKPLGRTGFLVGKFLGMMVAVFEGILLLSLILFLTLWVYRAPKELPYFDTFNAAGLGAWGFIFDTLIIPDLKFVGQGIFLSTLQVGILASISVSFAAFFPIFVSVSATALFYVIGNISRYFVVNAKGSGVGSWLAQGLAYLVPNFSYLNPTILLSEGGLLRATYLLWVGAYSIIYVCVVLRIATIYFNRREIR
jgi:ABC-type transport system involved in multi-copper enzyme maturation permease subunit